MEDDVGARIEHIIGMIETLYHDTQLDYFKAQANGWYQWVWMLPELKRSQWNIRLEGYPNGKDITLSKPIANTY